MSGPSSAPAQRRSTMKRALSVSVLCTTVFLLAASPARAQYKPQPLNDPATGESYHIEASAGWWFTTADMTITSAGSGSLTGLPGTSINAQTDLGMPSSQRLPALTLVLRPARSHKFRFNYIPISFDGAA